MDAIDPWRTSDPLGEALHLLRVNGAYYCRSKLTAPWAMALPEMPGYMWSHVVTAGRGWLDTNRAYARWLLAGDFALVPHGQGHELRSGCGWPTIRLPTVGGWARCATPRSAVPSSWSTRSLGRRRLAYHRNPHDPPA